MLFAVHQNGMTPLASVNIPRNKTLTLTFFQIEILSVVYNAWNAIFKKHRARDHFKIKNISNSYCTLRWVNKKYQPKTQKNRICTLSQTLGSYHNNCRWIPVQFIVLGLYLLRYIVLHINSEYMFFEKTHWANLAFNLWLSAYKLSKTILWGFTILLYPIKFELSKYYWVLFSIWSGFWPSDDNSIRLT